MDIRERAREVCELLRSAAALRRAGRHGEATGRAVEGAAIIARVADEVSRRLRAIQERVLAAEAEAARYRD